MVVKQSYWTWLFEEFKKYQGSDVTHLVSYLKSEAKHRRFNSPRTTKNHPTWAWVAGYLDGDGCYTNKKNVKNVGCISHYQDLCGLQLLKKAFGGTIYPPREDNTVLWRVNLGKTNRSFALKFLRKMAQHSRLKKWKIEQLLNFHNQSQRLTVGNPAG